MSKYSALRLLAASSLVVTSALAPAAQTTIPLLVTATVVQTCTITAPRGLAFGTYDPVTANLTAALNATGQISVTCTKGAIGAGGVAASMTLGVDPGLNPSGAQRQMRGVAGGNLLSYNVTQPPSAAPGTACNFASGTAWTNITGPGMLTLVAATNNLARLYNVCGSIPPNQNVAPDSYSDTVHATLNF